MKRYFGFALAMFFALVAIALVGGDSGAIAGGGCHGGRPARHRCHGAKERCHGGLLAKLQARKAAKCHGAQADACASDCGDCGDCGGDCGGEAVSGGCAGCGGAASGGCAGGDCGGAGVISEGVPTEAAPKAPEAPAAPAKT